jgi:UDP-N-acetylglucosamine--N-acetylmuramyl-(pentapeptide) pyrophosphoryl-undecaprenol N-acetylglucosamine transferase
VDTLYLAGPTAVDRAILSAAGVPFRQLEVGALRGVGPLWAAQNMVRLAQAVLACRRLITSFRPDVVLVTGGYVSVPAALAAAQARLPVLLYLPDAEPGWAVRLLAPLATRIALSFEVAWPALRRWERKLVVTGYPLRAEFASATRLQGQEQFGLEPSAPVLLVYGGSRAARRLNVAVAQALPGVLAVVQVIHICGADDLAQLEAAAAQLPPHLRARYHLHAYLHAGMAAAMAAADLALCRAGASTLAELPAIGLPAILVPYPYSGQHQARNAAFLAAAGGAVVVPDEELDGPRLMRHVSELVQDRARLAQMAAAMRCLARPDAATALAREVAALAGLPAGSGSGEWPATTGDGRPRPDNPGEVAQIGQGWPAGR